MGDHLDNFPVLYSLGSQAGIVDINHAFHLYYKLNVVCGLCFCRSHPDFEGFLWALRFSPSSNRLPFYRATNLVLAFQLTVMCYAIQIKSIMKRVMVLTIGKACKVDQPVHGWNASVPSNRDLYLWQILRCSGRATGFVTSSSLKSAELTCFIWEFANAASHM